MKLVWARRAALARNDIIDYIADDNVLAALEVDDAITSATLRLEKFPLLGKPGRIDGTRELVVHRHYILVYEVADDAVVILMALHASRQWPPADVEQSR
jgi:addiction module RelE/StbE family toxin